ncbi:MAG: hypothetical protein ACXWBN_15290 [Acidimicrobiales bacterium]
MLGVLGQVDRGLAGRVGAADDEDPSASTSATVRPVAASCSSRSDAAAPDDSPRTS